MLEHPGAVAGNGPDAPVAAHYGQPHAEQRALADGTAVVDLSHRGVVSVSGPERLTWLNVLTSQKLDQLTPGTSSETLFLDIQGRIEFDCHLVDDGETTWLTVEPGYHADLADWLQKMQFASRVEVTDRTGEVAVVGTTAEVPGWDGGLALARWQDPWPAIGEGGFPYTADPDPAQHAAADWSWNEYLVPASALDDSFADSLPEGWTLAGTMASEALRVAALRPRQGMDTDDRTIPHEIDLVRTGVHLSKGCYKGQETIARVHNLGRPPRRLTFLQLDGSGHTLVTPGSDVVVRPESADEAATARPVGTVTSVALHHEMGPIALAVLKRNTDPEAELLVRDGSAEDGWSFTAATQEVVVSPQAGQVVGRQTGFLRKGAR